MKRIITLFSLICAFVCVVSCSSSTSTPSGVVEAQLKAIQKGDAEQLTELFYFEGEKAEEGKQMIQSLMIKLGEKVEEQGGLKSYEILSEEISEDGNSAVVSYEMTFGDGSVEEEDSKTVLHDGKWYLHFGK